jgi:hypothetical protein
MPPRVLLIHGISSDGAWFATVGRALRPYFEIEEFPYEEYRADGDWRVATGLSKDDALRRGAASIGVTAAAVAAAGLALGPLGAAAALAAGVGGGWRWTTGEREPLRRRVTLTLRQRLEALNAGGEAPHVVAHSFGTYLVTRTLERHPDLRVDRMVLAGGVVRCDYPWGALTYAGAAAPPPAPGPTGAAAPGPGDPAGRDAARRARVRAVLGGLHMRVAAVRSETSTADPAVINAHRARWLLDGVGGSGWRGFDEAPGVVHTAADPLGRCPTCTAALQASGPRLPAPGVRVPGCAPVHNVPLGTFPHSDHFFGPGHGERFWLPFLWGYPPHLYYDYLRACTVVSDALVRAAEDAGPWATAAAVAARMDPRARLAWTDLGRMPWPWLPGVSLERTFVDRARALGRPPEPVVQAGLLHVVRAVAAAKAARADPHGDPAVVKRLHPPTALGYALARVAE